MEDNAAFRSLIETLRKQEEEHRAEETAEETVEDPLKRAPNGDKDEGKVVPIPSTEARQAWDRCRSFASFTCGNDPIGTL